MRPPQLKQQESTPEMWEIVQAGGALMWPIMLCSVVAAAIILERLWTLQDRRVLPPDLMQKVWRLVEAHQINDKVILALEHNSPLGRLLAAGLKNRHRARDVLMERLEDTGRHVVHELERFLNTLGTIAGVSPLLGLLGTVTGIIKAFNAINAGGAGDPRMLSGGIAEALVATAAGLCVAIPSLIGYRYLRGRVEGIVVEMEKNALRLVDAVEDAAADAAAAEQDEAQAIAAPAASKQAGARRPPDSAAAPVQPAPPAQHIAQA
jgi:biopolymer transport protein ExbB